MLERMRNIINITVLILACLLCFASCGPAAQVPQKEYVNTDYDTKIEMRSAELTKNMKIYFKHPTVLSSHRYCCKVKMKNDEVVIQRLEKMDDVFVQQCCNGYLVGLNLGEWDGWVRFYPYRSSLLERDPEVVLLRNCRGFIAEPGDRSKGYILTEEEGGEGGIYEITFDEASEDWECTLIGTFDGPPHDYWYDTAEHTIFIATLQAIVSVSTDTHRIKTIVRSETLRIEPTSIVVCGDKIWCGLAAGFWTYDMSTREETWYFVDWDSSQPAFNLED